jgi:sugar phosphate isomerase/epimerase
MSFELSAISYQLRAMSYELNYGVFMKISICNELFEGWAIEKVFDYAAQLGYDGVELAPFTLGETASDISAAERKRIL